MRWWNETRELSSSFRPAAVGLHGRSRFQDARAAGGFHLCRQGRRRAAGRSAPGAGPADRGRLVGGFPIAAAGRRDQPGAFRQPRRRSRRASAWPRPRKRSTRPKARSCRRSRWAPPPATRNTARSLFGPLNFTVPPFAYYTVGPTVSFPARSVRRREAHGRGAPGAAGISGLRTRRRLSVADRPCRRRGAGAGRRPRRSSRP